MTEHTDTTRSGYAGKPSKGRRGGEDGAPSHGSRNRKPFGKDGRGAGARAQSGKSGAKSPRTSQQRQARPAEESAEQTNWKPAVRTDTKASKGRVFALRMVREIRRRNAFAHDLLNARVATERMSAEDKAFARVLVFGVVMCMGTLDMIIDKTLKSPGDITEDVRDALRISTYEIIFLKKDEYAAVFQGVELVKCVAPYAGGVANHVLRRVTELKASFPFGNVRSQPFALANSFGFPTWLAKKLVAELGHEDASVFMAACNEQAPLYVYLNGMNQDPGEALGLLETAHCEPEGIFTQDPWSSLAFVIRNTAQIADGRVARQMARGNIIVSDASAQTIARAAIELSCGGKILEIGSGRGTKTVLLQAMYHQLHQSHPDMTCVDVREYKHEQMRERVKLCGGAVPKTICGDARAIHKVLAGNSYDLVFIDAPCSGLGTLRRHPEIRWRLKGESISEMAGIGAAILESAAKLTAVGGCVIYSTCTVASEENQQVIVAFLKSPQGAHFALEPIEGHSCFAPRLVSGGMDAHFAVCLRRKS